MAPSLVGFSKEEDRINRLMAEAAAESINEPVSVQIIIPMERLMDPHEMRTVMSSVPTDGVGSYFIWTPKVTEERLLQTTTCSGRC